MSSRTSAAGRVVRAIGVTLVVVLGLTLAPAASASFRSASQASTGFSTATLNTPTTSTISLNASCSQNKRTLTVTLAATGSLPYANALRVTADAGGTVSSKDQALTYNGNQVFTANSGGQTVVFKLEIRAIYKLDATHAWTSPPLLRTYTCS
ncbi:hypothetical protein [Pseudarthrobacter sp. MDT3-1]